MNKNNPIQKFLSLTGVRWVWSMKNEFTFLIVIVLLFSNLAGWLRAVDPTVAAFDIGLLMAPAVGLVAVAVAVLAHWIVWRFAIGKKQDEWFDGVERKDDHGKTLPTFDSDWNYAGPKVRLFFLLGVFFSICLIVSAFALIFGKVA